MKPKAQVGYCLGTQGVSQADCLFNFLTLSKISYNCLDFYCQGMDDIYTGMDKSWLTVVST